MLGIIPTTTVLDMLSFDGDDARNPRVRDVLACKRRSAHYADLLDEVRTDGITVPILILTFRRTPWLADGHHRVAAAVDLGLTHLAWTDVDPDET